MKIVEVIENDITDFREFVHQIVLAKLQIYFMETVFLILAFKYLKKERNKK